MLSTSSLRFNALRVRGPRCILLLFCIRQRHLEANRSNAAVGVARRPVQFRQITLTCPIPPLVCFFSLSVSLVWSLYMRPLRSAPLRADGLFHARGRGAGPPTRQSGLRGFPLCEGGQRDMNQQPSLLWHE